MTSMTYSRSYRRLVKLLCHACDLRPHFVQDLRVILSYDLVPLAYADHSVASSAAATGEVNAELFRECKKDLRCAFERDVSHLEGKRLPLVATHILYQKEIEWVAERLKNAVSSATQDYMKFITRISDGVQPGDYIPESFFESLSESRESNDESLLPAQNDKNDILYSAAFIGCYRDLVPLRRQEKEFPLVHCFVERPPSRLCFERYTKEKCLSTFIGGATSRIPHSASNENSEVRVTVSTLPFDASYRNQSEAKMGLFAEAHRQFYVEISLEALGALPLSIVNVHFLKLEMKSKEFSEDIGYMNPSDVLETVRESISSSRTGDVGQTDMSEKIKSFKVVFRASNDGPIAVKGILYYQLSSPSASLPVHAITFGPVLFEC